MKFCKTFPNDFLLFFYPTRKMVFSLHEHHGTYKIPVDIRTNLFHCAEAGQKATG